MASSKQVTVPDPSKKSNSTTYTYTNPYGHTVTTSSTTARVITNEGYRTISSVGTKTGGGSGGNSRQAGVGGTIAVSPTSSLRVDPNEAIATNKVMGGTVAVTPTSTYRVSQAQYVQMVREGYVPPQPSTRPTGVPISQALAEKMIGGGQPISLRSDVQYYAQPESAFLTTARGKVINYGRFSVPTGDVSRESAWNPIDRYLASVPKKTSAEGFKESIRSGFGLLRPEGPVKGGFETLQYFRLTPSTFLSAQKTIASKPSTLFTYPFKEGPREAATLVSKPEVQSFAFYGATIPAFMLASPEIAAVGGLSLGIKSVQDVTKTFMTRGSYEGTRALTDVGGQILLFEAASRGPKLKISDLTFEGFSREVKVPESTRMVYKGKDLPMSKEAWWTRPVSKDFGRLELLEPQTIKAYSYVHTPKSDVLALSIEWGSRAQPLITRAPEGYKFFGRSFSRGIQIKDLSAIRIGEERFGSAQGVPAPAGASEGEVARQFIRLTPQEQARISSFKTIARELGTERGPRATVTTAQEAFSKIEGFKYPQQSARIIESFGAEKGYYVFGSSVGQLLPEGFKPVKIGDIDFFAPSKTVEQIKTDLPELERSLRSVGEDVRISAQGKGTILEFSTGEKLLEAKSGINQEAAGLDDIAPVGVYGFKFPDIHAGLFGKTVKFGGIESITPGEQLLRKGAGSLIFSPGKLPGETGSFSEAGILGKQGNVRGLKDVAGLLQMSKGLSRYKEASWNPLKAYRGFKAETATNKFLGTYSETQQVDILLKLSDIIGGEKTTERISLPYSKEFAKSTYSFDTSLFRSSVFSSSSLRSSAFSPSSATLASISAFSPSSFSRALTSSSAFKSPSIRSSAYSLISTSTYKLASPSTFSPSTYRITSPSGSGSSVGSPSISTSLLGSPSPSPVSTYKYPSPSSTSVFTSPSPSGYGYPFTTTITKEPPRRRKTKSESDAMNKAKKLFGVEVRRRGKFKLESTAQGLGEAFKIGREKVSTSAAASFRIKELGGVSGGSIIPAQAFSIDTGQFYTSAKEPGVIIERPSRRIKSGGELAEITYKGIAANRRKRMGGLRI